MQIHSTQSTSYALAASLRVTPRQPPAGQTAAGDSASDQSAAVLAVAAASDRNFPPAAAPGIDVVA